MAETLEVEFVHHHTDTSGDEPVDYVPGQVAALPSDVARGLIGSQIANSAAPAPATRKAAAPVDAAPLATD